jgi:ferric-dicitrate binding protein FerR (iron transport regulator)
MPTMKAARQPAAQAIAWIDKLSRPAISNEDLHAFFAWRRDPENLAAYEAESRARKRRDSRFVSEPDPFGFTVLDRATGEAAAFAGRAQSGIPEADAEDIAEILNRRDLQRRVRSH